MNKESLKRFFASVPAWGYGLVVGGGVFLVGMLVLFLAFDEGEPVDVVVVDPDPVVDPLDPDLEDGELSLIDVNPPERAVIYAAVVTHNEDTLSPRFPDYLEDEETFWAHRDGTVLLAQMLYDEGVEFNFQTDWNYLLGSLAFDHGTESTNGKNLLNWLVEDMGFSVDPHSHENLGYNYADVAYLIEQHGVEASGVVGGFLAAPVSDSKWDYLQLPIRANKYDFVWTPEIAWGGGTALHQNEEDLWISGVWIPESAEAHDVHDSDGRLPNVGGYTPDWDGLQELIDMHEDGELDSTKIYTFSKTLAQDWLDEAFVEEVRDEIRAVQGAVDDGVLAWATIQEIVEVWESEYESEGNVLKYDDGAVATNDASAGGGVFACGDGSCSFIERKFGSCPVDCE